MDVHVAKLKVKFFFCKIYELLNTICAANIFYLFTKIQDKNSLRHIYLQGNFF